MKAKQKDEAKTLVAANAKARFHYHIEDVFEAGLSLKGPEVKSLRGGGLNLEGSFARIEGDEALLYNLHIAPYPGNTLEEIEPRRTRKLLLHRREIRRLKGRLESGMALIPLEVYFRRGWAKIALALAKGKRGPDKREALRKKAIARELERSFKGRYKI